MKNAFASPGLSWRSARARHGAAAAARTEDPETIGAGTHPASKAASIAEGRRLSGFRPDRATCCGFRRWASASASARSLDQIDGGFYNRLNVTSQRPRRSRTSSSFTGDRRTTSRTSSSQPRFACVRGRAAPRSGAVATKLPTASNESGLGLDTTDFPSPLLVGKTVDRSGSSATAVSASCRGSERGRSGRTTCALRPLRGSRVESGARTGGGGQWPIQYARRARSARDRDTFDGLRLLRPSLHARRGALRRRPDLWLDVS